MKSLLQRPRMLKKPTKKSYEYFLHEIFM